MQDLVIQPPYSVEDMQNQNSTIKEEEEKSPGLESIEGEVG